MKRSVGTYVLTAAGINKLLDSFVGADGERVYEASITSIGQRTVDRIRKREPARLSRFQSLFHELHLTLERTDYCAYRPEHDKARTTAVPMSELPPEAQVTTELVASQAANTSTNRRGRFTSVTAASVLLLLTVVGIRAVTNRPTHESTKLLKKAITDIRPADPTELIKQIVKLRGSGSQSADQTARSERQRADLCLSLVNQSWDAWYGPDEQTWIDRLSEINSDLQLCLKWLSRNDSSRQLELSGILVRYWYVKGDLIQNAQWLTSTGKRPIGIHNVIQARALVGLSYVYVCRFDAEHQQQALKDGLVCAEKAASLAHSTGGRDAVTIEATAYRLVGIHLNSLLRWKEARAAFDKALKLYRELGDTRGEAMTHNNRSFASINHDHIEGPAERAGEAMLALDQFRSIGNAWGEQDSSYYLREVGQAIVLTPATTSLVQAIEDECRRQIRLSYLHADSPRRHLAWVQLGRMARRLRNSKLEAECLLGICESDHLTSSPQRRGHLIGACQRYCRRLPSYSTANLDAIAFRSWYPASQRVMADRWLHDGGKMSLDEAMREAVGQ